MQEKRKYTTIVLKNLGSFNNGNFFQDKKIFLRQLEAEEFVGGFSPKKMLT